MSSYRSVRINLKAQEKRRLYLERISETTESYYKKFHDVYIQMKNENLDKVIPDEMEEIKNLLNNIKINLSTNPEYAKTLSLEVGSKIYGYRSLGYETRKFTRKNESGNSHIRNTRIEDTEEETETSYNNELYIHWTKSLDKFNTPILRDFAKSEIVKIKEMINSGKITTSEEIDKETDRILTKSLKDAEEWKKKHLEETKKEAVAEESKVHAQVLKETIKEPTEEIKNIINALESLNNTEERDKLIKISEKAEKIVMDERIRMETVKKIMKSLKDAGFTIETPEHIKDDEKDFVKITAKKPSGKRAACKVELDGKFLYKFDNYEGQACKEDIEKFSTKLEEVYGVKMSEERILWDNPDKISKTAKPIDNSNTNRR